MLSKNVGVILAMFEKADELDWVDLDYIIAKMKARRDELHPKMPRQPRQPRAEKSAKH